MQFASIDTDASGETHFGVQELAEREMSVGPPPNPTGKMSDVGVVTGMNAISFPAGIEAPAHNAPQAYIVIVLSGEAEIVVSDGEAQRFCAGDLLFCNDLTGKGHITRAITDLTLVFVNRAKS